VWGVVVALSDSSLAGRLDGAIADRHSVAWWLYTAQVIRRERKIESTQAQSGAAAFKQRQQ